MYEGKHIHFSEVDNKPLCSYSPKLCKQRRLNGYAFCIRHVLEDKTAPFKQCEYVAKYNSQRCTNPIPKSEDRRYCNSHLQVLGFIPKKERKKKNDAMEELRPRSHLESVALNITVPSFPLKTPNGLDELVPSPPPSVRPLAHFPDVELLDPFAFNEEEAEGEEAASRKGSAVRKKLQSKLALNQRLRLGDAMPEIVRIQAEHFSPSPAPCTPLQLHPPSPQCTQIQPSAPSPHPFPLPLPVICKPPPPPSGAQLAPAQTNSHSPSKKPAGGTSFLLPSAGPPPLVDSVKASTVILKPSKFTPPPACLSRLQRLVKLCTQHQQQEGDLFPHLGLDWSEDSAEDDEEAEHMPPYHYTWRLRERYLQDSSEDEVGSLRSHRLARLCTYLQQKYKHLCRLERAATRQKRCRYAFRKALLHAASKDPDCTGQLIQELRTASRAHSSPRPPEQREMTPALCLGSNKGQACTTPALPYTRHCFQHILLNRSQQLFSSCTAKFADGQQCSVPVFDITHQTPLCEEHAKKMDNFLRGDSNRKVQHQQQRKPRRKTKPPALTKKHKKKRRRGPRRPQKPIPPAVPQGNLGMPSSLTLPASIRSPSTPELSTDELPDDITNDMPDIPNDLELNQEDFSDVLPRLPDDLQDFDLFEGKNGELLPTTEEAEELERALQAMTSYTASLECLSSIGGLTQPDGVGVFSGAAVGGGGMASLSRAVTGAELGDLLNGRIPTENFTSLELDENLLHSASGQFSAAPPPPSATVSLTVASSNPLLSQSPLAERTFPSAFPGLHEDERASPRSHSSHLLGKAEDLLSPQQPYASEQPHSPPPSSHFSSEHVAPLMSSTILPGQLEVPLSSVPGNPPRSSWNNIPMTLADPSQFGNLLAAEGHLISTSLSTPPSTSHSVTIQPSVALSALPHTNFSGLPAAVGSSATPSSAHDLLTSNPPKQQLPQFSAAFGHQLSSHSGIPKDVQPSHSSTAPPAGFAVASATAASAASVTSPFTVQK
ncbi:INO80 complex subunit D isoform X1 [Erpetoichthys calabaricus]|uniref:INO80 complex subunit D isoform X1 n=1 Tax=Erpetoichthys calabaricus TaxID=27687 RepID=UPI00223482B8|nr:INO80 complex subunit D isoform X1 [Erpetoichthys calabaricus]